MNKNILSIERLLSVVLLTKNPSNQDNDCVHVLTAGVPAVYGTAAETNATSHLGETGY